MNDNLNDTNWILKYHNLNLSLKFYVDTTLGSDHSCDLIFEHESIQRRHARMRAFKDFVIIQRLAIGVHNVRVNNFNLDTTTSISSNSLIQCGPFKFQLIKTQSSTKESQLIEQIPEISSTSNLN